jgi:hypothetical protein
MKVLRVQKDGHYYHGAKLTVIFAIEPGAWLRMLEGVSSALNAGSDPYATSEP